MAFGSKKSKTFQYGVSKPKNWMDAANAIKGLQKASTYKIDIMNKLDKLTRDQEKPFKRKKAEEFAYEKN